jgi:hypothetical protein
MCLNNAAVTLQFYWFGEEPEWDDMEVVAFMPTAGNPNVKIYVDVADVLSDDDWKKIEHEIYWNEDKLKQQAMDQEY